MLGSAVSAHQRHEDRASRLAVSGRHQLLGMLRLFGALAVLVLIAILVSPRTRDGAIIFLDQRNLFDILARVSNVGILAVGMTLVILTGGIDLSVGSVLSLGSVVAAVLLLERGWNAGGALAAPALILTVAILAALLTSWLLSARAPTRARPRLATGAFLIAGILTAIWLAGAIPHGLPVPALVMAVMAVGLMVGCINGVLIAHGGLQPFIATLATMISIWGLAWLVTGETNARRNIATGEGATEAFNWLGSRLGGVIPVPGIFFLTAVLIAHLMLRYTRLGRRIYAIGSNEDAARLSGVPVAGTKVLVYGVSGLLAALTGTLWAAQYDQGFPDAGQGAELEAIAAVVIGGTSLMGGRGGVAGTFMGVLMFGVLNNILTLLEYTTNWQRLVTGAIIIAAVLLQEARFRAMIGRFWASLREG